MVQLVRNGMLARHLLASLSRVFSGFAISVAVAFPLGIALALLPVFSLPARPVLNFVRQIPPLAVIPLLILGLGIGEASRIAVVVMASFFPILLNAENGIRHVDSKLIEVGKTLSLPRSATFRYIAFPAFFPHFFVGVRLALSYSWRSLVGAEIVAASSGLGYMIREAETLSRSDTIICGVLVLGCVGALSDLLLEALSSRLFPWSQAS
jgi:sulfonate transport system permease protein